jgi:hypothetical protein
MLPVRPDTLGVRFNGEVKLGDLLTSISVCLAILTLLIGLWKERRLRQREYADRIRRAAARAIMGVSRRRKLALALYDEVQPIITDADIALVETQDQERVRDKLWRDMLALRARNVERSLEEKLEGEYVDLYGYDESIQALFDRAISELDSLERESFHSFTDEAQVQLLALCKRPPLPEVGLPKASGVGLPKAGYFSAQLGNVLRDLRNAHAIRFEHESAVFVERFRREVLRLITASDRAILRHRVVLGSAPPVRPARRQPRNFRFPWTKRVAYRGGLR